MNSAEKHRWRYLFRLFIGLLLLLPPTSGIASEIGDEIHGTIQDEEEAGRVFKKDWRFVPVPIPISDPTIGTGLAVAGLYLHPKKEGSSNTQTTLSGIVGL